MEATLTPAVQVTKEEADRTYRKVMLRLLPFLFASYVINYIDRANIGFAKLQFQHDLGFSDAVYGLGAGMFFVGYFFFEVPSNLYLQKVGARATMCRILIFWGVMSGLMSIVTTPTELYIIRFFLGVAEAGFFPGVILYLTYWFPSARRARATSILMTAVVVAGMLGGLASGWIMKEADGIWGLKGWQALFVIEAVPAVVLGLLVYVVLADRPEAAHWLTDREKSIVRHDLEADVRVKGGGHHGFFSAFKDLRVFIACMVYGAIGAGVAVTSLWVPSILRAAGAADVKLVGYLTMLPYACAGISMYLISRSSDRHLERRWHAAIPCVIGAAAFLAAGMPGMSLTAVVICLCVAAAGTFGALTVFWTIPAIYLKGTSVAAGIALISSVGAAIGGFGAAMVLGAIKTATGSFTMGVVTLASVMTLAAVILLIFIPASLLKERR